MTRTVVIAVEQSIPLPKLRIINNVRNKTDADTDADADNDDSIIVI